ncbi:MAG: hypothetical protein JXQ90_18390 [Cyclobacteriaceae bacterium]
MSDSKKKNLKGFLDSLVDEDGLKTEVTVTLTDRTLIKTSAYIVGTVIAGSILYFSIRGVFNST